MVCVWGGGADMKSTVENDVSEREPTGCLLFGVCVGVWGGH